ncbi:MAG: TatD family hydrolase [Candidatus Phocaeicola faecigallinarum]|uniref:TatD family hydrolase n=1 Tax=Candidatus Phocaeicola faecigallinarum TaxID=2838732 RepID=A0A948TDR9_9BACT|nr:TatD family hydrolase [Candidatus Phocaeicola faecigallinarum]
MKDKDTVDFISAIHISIGIHPWYVTADDIEEQTEWIKQTAINDKRVIAIGECGTDKLCNTDMNLQYEAFCNCITLSEELKLPLIIHSVKTSNEIIRLRKSIKPKQAWIIHGFRGKPEQALQYINNGLYLSFGKLYNTESIKITPHDRLLFETDEHSGNIIEIITNAAKTLDIPTDKIQNIASENAKRLFFNR